MRIYIVQKGDTLEDIVKKHDIEIDQVMKLNPHISSSKYVVPGMKIKIPISSYRKNRNRKKSFSQNRKKMHARTPERPLGSVEEIDEKSSLYKQTRIPLRRPQSLDRSFKTQSMEKATTEKSFFNKGSYRDDQRDSRDLANRDKGKTYSQKQYYRNRQMSNYPHMMNRPPNYVEPMYQMTSPYYQPQQPYHPHYMHHCPCQMHYWHMHQSMYGYDSRQYRNNKRFKHKKNE